MALKWYLEASATDEQRRALEVLVRKGSPNGHFLWPIDVVSSPGSPGFGYLMPLREPRYKSIVDLMKRRVEPSFRAVTTAAVNLSHDFLQLHAQGMCYRDISFGNVAFDPNTGEVLICDNDSVAVDDGTPSSILGTPRFMAPEVVTGRAYPSAHTDLFSLSVLLFYILMMHHPLEGKREAEIRCLDLPAMRKLYGEEPLFIFDPYDGSNAPDDRYHQAVLNYWPIYPEFLHDLFTRSFTDGIRDPLNGRVRESEWRAAMIRLRDCIVYCSRCGLENFVDVDAAGRSAGKALSCWQCKRDVQLPPRLHVGDQVIMLNHDSQLFPHHVDERRKYDFSNPVAAVVQHPANPNIWGLKNLSTGKWFVTIPDGTVREVEPGRSATLAPATKINFGTTQGIIEA